MIDNFKVGIRILLECFIIVLVIISICFLYEKTSEIHSNQYTKKYVDSLKSELEYDRIKMQRYDYIFDMIDEIQDTKCKEKIDSIINSTE